MTLDELQALIRRENVTLAFIDDSGTPGKPLPRLPRDMHWVAAVVMNSAEYCRVSGIMDRFLIQHQIRWFHATDILAGKKEWRSAAITTRQDAFCHLFQLLDETPCQLLYCPLNEDPEEAYSFSHIKGRLKEEHQISINAKTAILKATRGAILRSFPEAEFPQLAVICESDKANHNDVAVHEIPNCRLLGGGIITVAKAACIRGVELADSAAWLVNRVHHLPERQKKGNANEFDEIVGIAWNKFGSRFRNVVKQLDR